MKVPSLLELKELIVQKLEFHDPIALDPPGFTHAAVLVPIISEGEILKFILTKRTQNLRHHKGEISFPGGQQSRSDGDLIRTALRETEEEIGLKEEQIEVLGRIDDLLTITKYVISPFIGIIREEVELYSNETEVAEILKVPLELFLDKTKFKEKYWENQGIKYPLYYYYWRNYEIWGATAYIINQFMEIVFDFQPSSYNIKRTNPDLIERFLKTC
ncbi:MAG: NUDIX hydrolase [Candidatus Helarchaeota archaeon]